MELLSNKFNSLLTQYKNTYQDFLDAINTNNSSFASVKNSAFIGGSTISTLQNSSVNDCTSSCSSNKLCSGATYNNSDKSCTLSSGTGNITKSSNQTAIVKQALYYSYQLQSINNELTQTNTDMMSLANSRIGDYQQTQQLNEQKSTILQNNYKTLQEERSQIEEMIRQYETLNSAYENGNINVTSNYYYYIMYLFVAIFLILILVKYSMPNQQIGGGNHIKIPPIIFIILSIIIIGNAIIKNNY